MNNKINRLWIIEAIIGQAIFILVKHILKIETVTKRQKKAQKKQLVTRLFEQI